MISLLIFVVTVFPLTFATVGAKNMSRSLYDREAYYCLLPPFPEHGRYTVSNYPSAMPGEIYSSVKLDISCDLGYLSNNTIKSIYCVNGDWSASIPHCVRDMLACGLKTEDGQLPWEAAIYQKISKTYTLFIPGSLITATKIISNSDCSIMTHLKKATAENTIIETFLKLYSYIICKNIDNSSGRNWIQITYINHLMSLVVFAKVTEASYFHTKNNELVPASNFVVTVDNKYKLYKDTLDPNSQQSDVIDIKVPSNYGGQYENNIAIVVVKIPFHFHMSVRPVCLDFDNNLEGTQLTKGSSGKTLGWTTTLDKMSYRLDEVDLSYVTNEDCKNMLSTANRRYVNKDIFCMRCDFGITGPEFIEPHLAFLESTTQRYYLRGLLGYIFQTEDGMDTIILYTPISKYEDFIKEHL